MDLGDYLPILLMLGLALIFGGVSIAASRLLAPRNPTPAKTAAYECGIVPEREPAERFPVRFYMVAMLFILFDIEIVFMYPWAVIYGRLALFGFVEMALFTVALLVIYAYIWRDGLLDWAPKPRLLSARVTGGEQRPDESRAA